jgi:uncharacterized coiled-coil protein SlyX
MLKFMSKMDQIVTSLNQTVNSHSQPIAKFEAQMGQIANTLNKREEGTLPSQPMAN